jgi:hypothetical protein
MSIPPLTRNVRLRLVTGNKVRSAVVDVVVVPTVSTSSVRNGEQYDVSVATDGAEAGNTLVLQRFKNGNWLRVRRAQLDGNGQASFAVPVPPKTTVHYRVFLQRTKEHAMASSPFDAGPAA